jgi:hypothetical protein
MSLEAQKKQAEKRGEVCESVCVQYLYALLSMFFPQFKFNTNLYKVSASRCKETKIIVIPNVGVGATECAKYFASSTHVGLALNSRAVNKLKTELDQ